MEYIIPIVSIEAFGDFQLAKYVEDNSTTRLLLGYGAYAGVVSLFIKSIEKKGLAWSNSAWDGWSNLATGAVAIFVLGERPTSRQYLGIVLISAGLFLLDGDMRKPS
jgi:multidrug transporter EmrE-like cation transporter